MNLIEQHMQNVSRELAQLEDRLARLKAEQAETRKLLGNLQRYRKSLIKQYPSNQAVLPLDEPDEGDTDDAEVDANTREPLVPDEWGPDYEVPEEPTEAEAGAMAREWKPSPDSRDIAQAKAEFEAKPRRHKTKATAEEVADG